MENKDPNFQMSLAFIDREIDSNTIQQRMLDGYINGTALCKACNKEIKHYLENTTTKQYLKALASKVGIPTSALIQSVRGGVPELQGTWVHPRAVIHLSMWANPEAAVQVTEWVFEWMNGNIKPQASMPYHLQRYLLNKEKIPNGQYFSVFNEIVYSLIAPLEKMGYTLPDNLVPDISEAKIFCNWLRDKKGIEPKTFPTYDHEYGDGRIVKARLYPNKYLADFRAHFNDVWLLQRAQEYFSKKDVKALSYVQKMILQLPKAAQNQIKILPNKRENSSNDDFDKGMGQLTSFEID